MQPIRDALRNLPEAVYADLLESPESYLLVLDLPGATKEGVDIQAYDHRLEIEATREKGVPEGFAYLSEDRSLFLDATIPLPMDALSDAASATMADGVLEITIPRTEDDTIAVPIED